MNALGAIVVMLAGLAIEPPTELEPLSMNAELSTATAKPGDTVTVTIGVEMLPGWHIYAYVPANEPYVKTQWLLDLPPVLSVSGDWIGPPPTPDAQNPELDLHEGGPDTLIFMRELRVHKNASGVLMVRAGLLYQACNVSRCLPPARKTVDLKLNVTPSSE